MFNCPTIQNLILQVFYYLEEDLSRSYGILVSIYLWTPYSWKKIALALVYLTR